MKSKRNFLLCITGQTGSGKSALCRLLEKKGFVIIYSDQISRQAVQKGTKCLKELVLTFGNEILNEDGTLNRKKLAEIAFNDPQKTALLNSVTHPHIRHIIKNQIKQYFAEGHRVVVLEVPLLAESGLYKSCDAVVVMTASEQLRQNRITKRDNLSEQEALLRIRAHQMPDYKDVIRFENSGEYRKLQRFASELYKTLRGLWQL